MDKEIALRVDERLQDLYERHLDLGDAARHVTSFYSSRRGYYEPAQAGEERDRFAVCLVDLDGDVHTAGDHDVRFPLHSLSKVFVYALALEQVGREKVLRHVGVKPSADSFATLGFDQQTNRPYNPMVNGGALATTDLVLGDRGFDDAFAEILDALRRYAGNPDLTADEATFQAELCGADRNRATAYLMRSNHMLPGDVDEILALYLRQCSVMVTCRELAVMAATLACGGVNPTTGERVLELARVRDVLSVMYTCGMYDFAGEWAYEIGVPAKSGVSGGILAAVPGKLGIGVFSPGLDRYGNSVRGTRVCADIAGRLGLHVFASDAEDAVTGEAQPR
jgi:glutaminase